MRDGTIEKCLSGTHVMRCFLREIYVYERYELSGTDQVSTMEGEELG